jgi:uncharacterized membrane-anchored protein YjiN (DUF445 family)
MRRIATSLVALMALVFVAARLLQGRAPWLAFVGAFAEAALVGALADWFAVTALFRRPFGLPIPHTAIIPTNKDRIGDSIGLFLEQNFMTYEVLRGELATIDFVGATARWLADEANTRALAAQAASAVPALLRLVDDKDAGALLRRAMSAAARDVRFAPLAGQVLGVLVEGGQHHALLERVLAMVARALEENRGYIRQKVHENSPRWMPKSIDEKFFERLMDGVQSILADFQGEDSEWRARFEQATAELLEKLATSPEYERRLRALVMAGLSHPLFVEYAGGVWQTVRARLLADLDAPDSRLQAALAHALSACGEALAADATLRDRFNDWLRVILADTIVGRRDLIAAVVTRAIRKWDAQTVSRKLELHVGKDLQYIRINGTLVGGLVGLLLYVAGLFL